MNKLIIIGNGFDLAHGLNTRYIDFVNWYLRNAVDEYYLNGKYIDSLIELSGLDIKIEKPRIKDARDFEKFTKRLTSFAFSNKSDFLRGLIDKSNLDNWVDIESEYYSKLVRFYKDNEINDSKYWETIKNSVRALNTQFDFITEILIRYLKQIEFSISIKNERIAEILVNISTDFFTSDLDNTSENKLLILNFNYTSVLNLYSEELYQSDSFDIINIHGSIDDVNNPIIFGYGDEMDPFYEKIENLNSNEFLRHIKSFGYFKTSNYRNFLRFVEDNEYEVYIMGHSCGISDRILLNSIFENEKCKGIQIFYHKKSETENDYFEKTQEISRHFRPQNKDSMRRKIVPFDKCIPLTLI